MLTSVVHEPSGLEPSSGLDSSRLESLGIQLLAARTGVHEPTRTLDSSLLAVLGGFLVARADSSRLESRSGLGSSLESRVP